MMIASRHGDFEVKKGDKLAGTRIIPLVIEKEKMEQVKALCGNEPIMRVEPYKPHKVGIVTTGNEVFYGRIEDTFTPVVISVETGESLSRNTSIIFSGYLFPKSRYSCVVKCRFCPSPSVWVKPSDDTT